MSKPNKKSKPLSAPNRVAESKNRLAQLLLEPPSHVPRGPERSQTVPARMSAVMGNRTMAAGELQDALTAAGETFNSSNLRSYISTTLNSTMRQALDANGNPLRLRSGALIKVHYFTCLKRGLYRVATAQDLLVETRKLQALDAEAARPPSERAAIIDAITAAGGNQTQAAKQLGIGRNTLRDRLRSYGRKASEFVKPLAANGTPPVQVTPQVARLMHVKATPTVPTNGVTHGAVASENRANGNGLTAHVYMSNASYPELHEALDDRIKQVLFEQLGAYLKVNLRSELMLILNERRQKSDGLHPESRLQVKPASS